MAARARSRNSKLDAELPESIAEHLRKAPQPQWFAPMLATFTEDRFSRPGWIFEPKYDGERCLVFSHDGKIRLLSRNQKQLNEKYPELIHPLESQNEKSFVLDGEIVTFQDSITSFAKLQQRMQVRHPSGDLQREVPVRFCAFDLLYLGGFDLREVPLLQRKQMLRSRFEFSGPLIFTEHRETDGKAYFQKACKAGMEGLIAKNGESVYRSKRSSDWLKFKCIKEQEFVIGGYTEPKGQRVGFGALLAGYYSQGKLNYAGKVGTGYDTTTLRALTKRLSALRTDFCPFEQGASEKRGVHWIKPRLVAEIGFTEWTSDGKLRHPRFLGLRDDKEPREVTREQ
jgi:DNA ligase D-like protein (predicted ligase)